MRMEHVTAYVAKSVSSPDYRENWGVKNPKGERSGIVTGVVVCLVQG